MRRAAIATAGTAAVGGAASTTVPRYSPIGRAAADASDSVILGPHVAPVGVVSKVSGWLAGIGGSDDDESVEEYNESEWLRIQGDAYIDALYTNTSNQTATTWLSNNADRSEGPAYTAGVKRALTEIEENGATREEAITAAENEVREQFSVAQREMLHEAHLEIRKVSQYLQQFLALESDVDESILDAIRIWERDDIHTDEPYGAFHGAEFDVGDVEYTLFNGETVAIPSFYIHFTAGDAGTGYNEDTTEGILAILGSTTAASLDDTYDLIVREDNVDGQTSYPSQPVIKIKEFDAASYENAYGVEVPDVSGHQTFTDIEMWKNAHDDLVAAKDTAVSSVGTFIDNVYDDLVNGDLTSDEIMTHQMLVEQASDDDPLVQANSHLAMLGRATGMAHTTIALPAFEDVEAGETSSATVGKNDLTYEDLGRTEITGTIYADPTPGSPLSVGETYLVDDLGGDATIDVMFAFTIENENGEEAGYLLEFKQEDEFRITDAERLDENGDLVSVDSIEFSDGAPTESPANYDEMHDELDALETLQTDLLEQQQTLIEELAKDDDPIGFSLNIGNISNSGIVGLAIIGATILVVISFVTDLVTPGR